MLVITGGGVISIVMSSLRVAEHGSFIVSTVSLNVTDPLLISSWLGVYVGSQIEVFVNVPVQFTAVQPGLETLFVL